MLKIRFARAADYRGCKVLDPRISRSVFLAKLAQRELIVATSASAIVGYLRLEFIWLWVPYISWIVVDEDYREKGVARSLLSFVIKELKRKKQRFILSSYQDNAYDARAWHSKMGFRRNGEVSRINEDGSKEVFCLKRF